MNDKTIIELAKRAGFERLGHTDNDWVCYPEDIETFAALVAAAERKVWADEFAGLVVSFLAGVLAGIILLLTEGIV